MTIGKGYYVYRFMDVNNKIIYVGQTQHLEKRLGAHMSGHSNANLNIKDTTKIEYTSLNTLVEAEILEKYIIVKHRPKLNKTDRVSNEISKNIQLEIKNNFVWKEFDMKRYDNTYKVAGQIVHYDHEIDMEIKINTYTPKNKKEQILVIRERSDEKNYYVKNDSESIYYSGSIEEAAKFTDLDQAIETVKNLDSEWGVFRFDKTLFNKCYYIESGYYDYRKKLEESATTVNNTTI